MFEDFDLTISSFVKGSGDMMRSRVRMELKRAKVVSRKMTMLATLVVAIRVVV